MDLYFDLDSGNFVSGPGTRDVVSTLSFKRGDTVKIPLRFVSGTTITELDSGATGQLGLKPVGDYDGDFTAACPSWTKTGTGTTTVYTFLLNLATTDINTLLGVGAAADVASVQLNFELEFLLDGIRTSSNTVLATVHNDVIRGDETGPTDIEEGTPTNILISLSIAGTLTSNGSTAVTFPTMLPVGTSQPITQYTATGAGNTDSGVEYHAATDGDRWYLNKLLDGAVTAAWIGSDAEYIHETATWTPTSPATGTPVLTAVPAADASVGSMQVDADFLYVCCKKSAGIPTWKRLTLEPLS